MTDLALPTASELESLRDMAIAAQNEWRGCTPLLRSHDVDFPLHPVVVEFAGTPKSGKTTCIDIIDHFFRRMRFATAAPREGAQLTPDFLKDDLAAFNTYTLCYALSQVILACHSVGTADLVLLDRGPFDSLAWMSLVHRLYPDKLDSGDLKAFQTAAGATRWASYVDLVVLLRCRPDVSIEREYRSKLIKSKGTAMTPEVLEPLLEEYRSLPDQIRSFTGNGPLVLDVDTSEAAEPIAVARKVAKAVIELFREKSKAVKQAIAEACYVEREGGDGTRGDA